MLKEIKDDATKDYYRELSKFKLPEYNRSELIKLANACGYTPKWYEYIFISKLRASLLDIIMPNRNK